MLAGACVNIALAWFCVLWMPMTHRVNPPAWNQPGYPPQSIGPYGIERWWTDTYGFGWRRAQPTGARGGEGDFRYYCGGGTPSFWFAGWPMYALESRVDAVHDPQTGQALRRWDLPTSELLKRGPNLSDIISRGWTRRYDGSWLDTLKLTGYGRLPLVPMPVGFTVNTVFYALLVAGLLWTHRVLMRRFRERDGHKHCCWRRWRKSERNRAIE
jgi:hypothetical protein